METFRIILHVDEIEFFKHTNIQDSNVRASLHYTFINNQPESVLLQLDVKNIYMNIRDPASKTATLSA